MKPGICTGYVHPSTGYSWRVASSCKQSQHKINELLLGGDVASCRIGSKKDGLDGPYGRDQRGIEPEYAGLNNFTLSIQRRAGVSMKKNEK